MMKLTVTMRKAFYLTLLCAIFSNVRSYASTALEENKSDEWKESYIEKNITGKIADENGEPLAGANVTVKGTTIGTNTDVNGNYTLAVPEDAKILVISYVGYISKEVTIENSSTIDVILAYDVQSLSELVVVGYGTQKKRDLTGAISSVKAADIVVSSNSDIGHTLKGKAAGLMIRENSAQPGGGLDIMVRGAGSVNASNAPLIVIDGFPITDLQQPESGNRYQAGTQSILNAFNPNDIESIEVLKDASATSIYGARAAHGVILVTTKRGIEGKPIIQYSTSFSIQKYKDSFDVLPLNEWMQVRNEAAWEQWMFENNVTPWGAKTLEEAKANPVGGDFFKLYTQNAINNVGRGTDWLGLVTRDGTIQQHNISVAGGTKATRFLLSGNYYDHKGVIKNSGFERYTIRGNIDQEINKYVKLGFNFSFSRINNNNSSLGSDQWENSGIIRAAIQQGPHIRPIDEDGNYPLNPQLSLQPNPYSLLTITDKGRVERTMVSSFMDITPVKDLVIKLKAGMDRGLTNRWTYLPKTTLHGALENGKASISEIDKNSYLLEGTVNYTKRIGNDHSFNVLAGVSEEKFIDGYNNSGNTGFISDAFLWNNLNSGSGTKSVSSSGQENLIASYFGRLNYNFSDRYLLTFTVRTDGASVFARNNKWGTFPSIALGWNIAEESFFSTVKSVVSQLKVRLSYGQTGNASIGSNAFAAYSAYPAWLSGDEVKNIGVSLSRLENPDLKWETTTETNFGIDYSILKDRISGSLEIYRRVISDLLAWKPINSYHEINGVMANVGETQSQGFELTIVTRNIQKVNFQWKSMVTFSRFKDNWLKRANDWKPAVYENTEDPIRAIYSRISDGIMQVGDVVPSQPELEPGMIKIADIDGYKRDELGNPMVDENGRFLRLGEPDGIIDDADTRLIGTYDPSLIVGLTNILSYKNFTLNFDFNGMFGRKLADPNYTAYGVSAEGIYTYGYNALRTVKDRWTPEKPSTTHPSSYYGWSPYGGGNFFLQNAWFMRLQNVSLGYKLPKRWFGEVLQEARIHVDAQNLLVISPYTGIDPETDSYTAAYPNVKTFTMGINLIF
jgi:TonB-linked SusC/RagA family outer membrane protein